MVMRMHYSLAAVSAAVVDDTETGTQVFDLCDLVDGLGNISQIFLALSRRSHVAYVIEMLLGNDEHVYGSHGIDIVEAEDLIVLVNLC